MTIRFYVSDDGEVLSNKDYPVDKPLLIRPSLLQMLEPDGSVHPVETRLDQRLFRAITMTIPDNARWD